MPMFRKVALLAGVASLALAAQAVAGGGDLSVPTKNAVKADVHSVAAPKASVEQGIVSSSSSPAVAAPVSPSSAPAEKAGDMVKPTDVFGDGVPTAHAMDSLRSKVDVLKVQLEIAKLQNQILNAGQSSSSNVGNSPQKTPAPTNSYGIPGIAMGGLPGRSQGSLPPSPRHTPADGQSLPTVEMLSGVGKHLTATLRMSNGQSVDVRPGMEIQPGMKVESIQQSGVALTVNGKRRMVYFGQPATPATDDEGPSPTRPMVIPTVPRLMN